MHRLIYIYIHILVYTDLSDKEPPRHVAIGRVVTSRSLSVVLVSTLTQNAKYVGSAPAPGTIFPISTVTMILYKVHTEGLLNLLCKVIASMYVIISIHRFIIPGG